MMTAMAVSPASTEGPDPPSSARAYRWFGASVATWFGAWGMQSVLFTWLVVGELRADPEWVGLAQMSAMLPSLLLLLLGGAMAERRDTRRMLLRLQLAATVPVALLALLVLSGRLTLPALLLYGAAMGTLAAFVLPARETLLARVAGPDMMRAVTGMTAVQFGSQGLGTLLAGGAAWLGSGPMLLVQATVLVLGTAAVARLPAAPPHPRDGPRESTLREIGEGLAEVARTPRLRAPVLLVLSVGLLFIGPFLVIFPLLVRDHYQRGVAALSILLMLFPLGTITGSLTIRARGGIRRKGRAALVALVCGASMLGAIGQGLPFAGTILATYGWGLAGSVFINCSRTLVQEAAPPAHRARVLSIFQLGFLGAGPVGALTAGLLVAQVGLLPTLELCAAAMLLFVGLTALFTDTARID